MTARLILDERTAVTQAQAAMLAALALRAGEAVVEFGATDCRPVGQTGDLLVVLTQGIELVTMWVLSEEGVLTIQ